MQLLILFDKNSTASLSNGNLNWKTVNGNGCFMAQSQYLVVNGILNFYMLKNLQEMAQDLEFYR